MYVCVAPVWKNSFSQVLELNNNQSISLGTFLLLRSLMSSVMIILFPELMGPVNMLKLGILFSLPNR